MSYFITDSGKRVFIISANFLTFNFKALQKEYAEKHYITWELPEKSSHQEKLKDICYFYYSHLPSASGATLGKILMRGTIEKGPHKRTLGDIYDTGDPTLVDAITITDLQPVRLKDQKKYCWESLVADYGISNYLRTIQQLKSHQAKLYEEIERDIQDDPDSEKLRKSKNGFAKLIEYFETPCFFQDRLHPKKNPLTFSRRNGLNYYESHHFIPESTKSKVKDPRFATIVDDPENRVPLCPYCHRRIHLGTPQDVAEMLRAIYDSKKDLEYIKNISQYIGTDNVLAWLNEIYAVAREDKNELLEGIE